MVTIQVPPLRDRTEDIRMLVRHFAELAPATYGIPSKRFGDGALEALEQPEWPGNVRQLKNAVARLMILSPGNTVQRRDVLHLVPAGAGDMTVPGNIMALETLNEFKEAAEKAFIAGKLRDYDWNVSEAARRMGMPRSNLYKKIERHGLERE